MSLNLNSTFYLHIHYVNDFKNELKGRDRKAKGEYEGGLLFYENGVYQKSQFYLPATTN